MTKVTSSFAFDHLPQTVNPLFELLSHQPMSIRWISICMHILLCQHLQEGEPLYFGLLFEFFHGVQQNTCSHLDLFEGYLWFLQMLGRWLWEVWLTKEDFLFHHLEGVSDSVGIQAVHDSPYFLESFFGPTLLLACLGGMLRGFDGDRYKMVPGGGEWEVFIVVVCVVGMYGRVCLEALQMHYNSKFY